MFSKFNGNLILFLIKFLTSQRNPVSDFISSMNSKDFFHFWKKKNVWCLAISCICRYIDVAFCSFKHAIQCGYLDQLVWVCLFSLCVHSCPLVFCLFVCHSFMSDFETADLLVWNENNNEWMNFIIVCCNSSVIFMVIFALTELFFWPLPCLPCAVPPQVSSIWKWVQ